jgi:hypothetical protein
MINIFFIICVDTGNKSSKVIENRRRSTGDNTDNTGVITDLSDSVNPGVCHGYS